MRKITQNTINAFLSGKNYCEGNTSVQCSGYTAVMFLHGNDIAMREIETGRVYIRNAGWPTATTKERLNGIPGVSIQQKRGKWYLNGVEWNGDWFLINGVGDTL